MMNGIKIMRLDRGIVKVGYLERHPELAFHWFLRHARIIRNWGTTEGLEQIAEDGPTPQTKLDRLSRGSSIPFRAVIEIIEVEENKWRSHLTPKDVSPERRNKTKPPV